MKIKLLFAVGALIAFGGAASEVAAQSKEAALVREARIAMAQARAQALERVAGGTIEFAKLERARAESCCTSSRFTTQTNAKPKFTLTRRAAKSNRSKKIK